PPKTGANPSASHFPTLRPLSFDSAGVRSLFSSQFLIQAPMQRGMILRDADVPVGLSGCQKSGSKGVLKVLNRLIGAIFMVALASSPIAFAQTGQRGTQGGRGGTASSKPFDPHDLSGF